MNEIVIEIVPEMEDERIDKCISNYMENLSRSYIQKIIKDGSVSVNGQVVKANYRVKVDDKVRVAFCNFVDCCFNGFYRVFYI